MKKKVCIEYLLSEKGRKASLLAGGDGKERQQVCAPLSPEIIKLATVDSHGNAYLQVGFTGISLQNSIIISKIKVKSSGCAPGWDWQTEIAFQRFDAPQSVEALVAWEANRVAALAAAEADPENQAEIARLKAVYAVRQAAKAEADRRDRDRAREEEASRRAKQEAERAFRRAEKAAWVAEHGSDYLRRAVTLGYDCQRQYVTERAATELPEFVVDFDDQARWKERACPGPDALGILESLIGQGYEAEVVWLTAPPWETDEYNSVEAVVVRNYLGKYDLVKIL